MIHLASTDTLSHVLDGPVTFLGPHVQEFLLRLGITKHIAMLFLSGLLVCLLVTWYARRIKLNRDRIPRGGAGLLEVTILFVRDEIVRPVVGPETDRCFPFAATLFLLILTCNLLGLVPGFATATGNTGVNAGLAIVAFCAWHVFGIRRNGLKAYLRSLVPEVPVFVWPVMLVVELVSHLVRPFALTIRLFANMLAGHTVLLTILGFTKAFTSEKLLMGGAVSLASVAGAVALSFLEIFVAFLQAFIFVFLTVIFTGMALHPEH